MTDYILSLDLGQAQDYSAAVVLHRRWWRAGERPDPDMAKLWHGIPLILKWNLGTPYPKVVEEVAETCALLETKAQFGVKLIVDAGGPGRPVMDMLKERRLRPIGVTITAGDLPHDRDDGTMTVPKRDICSALVVAYQNGDVKANPRLAYADELEEQISKFGYVVKPRSRKVGYENLDPEVHDDIVVAASLGLWYSTTRLPKGFPGARGEATVEDHDYDPLAN